MLKIKNCEEVEVQIINTAQKTFYFGNEFILRDARKITGIEVFNADVVAKTPTGGTVISSANLKKAFLTLVGEENNREIVSNIPLYTLLASSNNGQIREFDMPMINPSKCYITFGDNTTLSANDIVPFAFYYEA